jgi:ribonuclease D
VSETLQGAELLYLDTEFDSSREGTRLSLVQVSRGETVYLIDALRLTDLSPLLSAFDAPGTTWVLHAGQQDVALLTNRLGLSRPPRLFDTQIAWALVTVEHSASLAYLKYRLLGVRGEKTHQADDWRRRPLPPPQLAYAAEDVVYLPAIHRALLQRCEALGRSEAVTEATLEMLLGAPEVPGPLSIESFRNAWQLEREGQSVLRFLIGWYNGLSLEDRVSAPETKGMLAIASRRPRSMEDLASLRAVPRRTVNLHGRTLLEGIQRAVSGAGANEFTAIEPAPYGSAAEILAHGWLEAVRAEVCAALGIAPEIAFPARLTRRMRETAVAAGKVEAASAHLTGWRRQLLEHEFLARAARFGKLP